MVALCRSGEGGYWPGEQGDWARLLLDDLTLGVAGPLLLALKEALRAGAFALSPVGVLALDISSGSPATLLRLEELRYGLLLLGGALSGEWRAADELDSCLLIGASVGGKDRKSSTSAPSGGPPHVQRFGLLFSTRWASSSSPPAPPPPPRLSVLLLTRASSRSCSLRSEMGKKRHSLTEPSLRRRRPGEALSCAMVTASSGGGGGDRTRPHAP